MTRFLPFTALLIFAGAACAIELDEDHRIPNIDGMCAWSSLETLGRANGVKSLHGLRDYRRLHRPTELAYDHVIRAELDSRGVHYEFRPQGSYDRTLLEKYSRHFGVAAALKPNNPWCGGPHEIVVTDFGPEWVEFYDSSRPLQDGKPKIWRCGRSWFEAYWWGQSIVVFPGPEA